MRETSRDLSALIVPQAGRVVASDDTWGPYRLVDFDGTVVESVAAYLRDLQAVRRSVTTARSYALDLLRGFRFLWAVEVGWVSRPGTSAGGCRSRASLCARTGAAEASRWAVLGPVVGCVPGRMRRRCAHTARRCCAASTISTSTPGPDRPTWGSGLVVARAWFTEMVSRVCSGEARAIFEI
jgi:hypothetical protein